MSAKQTAMQQYQLVETRLQEKMDNGTTRCNLCLWRCKIAHGQRGFCQAHVNRNGTLYNLSYGILSSIDIDAIEDKPVRHYRPGTQVMSVGSYGCSFRCNGCHNLEISWGVSALDALAKGESTEAWVSPEALVETALRSQVQGIAFTYSEPAVWLEYIMDVCTLAHEKGLYTVYVSNSYITDEALEMVAPHIDVLCSDIKSMQDSFYQELCRPAKVEQVLHSIKKAQELGIHVETRTNIIPGKNDNPEEYYQIACWVRDNLGADSPWHITRFFPAYQLSHLPATPEASLFQAQAEAQRAGLNNIYVHNDKGCDCAKENLSIEHYLNTSDEAIREVKKCQASCCGDEGILVKKYEQKTNPNEAI
ncbi:AmmeMemoRadiSam system radical SAM enzyme [sulfur-oxidizing endosymbiont of Gigantopelta aegis]|uniref:AmmeMemoRadiSam system radical SAM enzyme n=1 Tax=sulfur-oxidizing endosymbiont of Gigantopelta aegis TaxID=2794934 RepID=UPI0018DCCDFB|nr:AmmeMemoRadiSam system radical SAM enzyme [sulfur-oxidizing endosymbiont of Gigantopelta aegis]